MKRLLFFICTLLCANVLMAQTTFWIDSLQYQVTSTNPAKVLVYEAKTSITTAIIPSTVSYDGTTYSVTSIGEGAFEYCGSLTSVTIPNSVTSIGNYAFRNCLSLTSVTIPNSVTSIGNSAFRDCDGLTSVTIGNSVTSIGNAAFYDSGLTSVTIGNSVTSIGEWAFYRCSSLTSVTIPNSVTSIGDYAFRDCDGLTSVTIPNSVTSIGEGTFNWCTSLTSITIPNSVTSIGDYAFDWCTSLTSIDIPNSVTSIGIFAFSSCSSLTSVTIPNSVTYIGDGVFSDCTSLTSVDIPNSVTSIAVVAFQYCSSLTSVDIPNSVTSIGEGAFYYCSNLTSVTCLAETAPSLGSIVFSSTPSTKTLTVPCESDYSAWESATTWASVERIGCEEEECVDVFTIGDLTYEKTSATEVSVKDCNSTATEVIIPASVEQCGITYSVTAIGNSAFYGSSSLTYIDIPNGVTSIGERAFYGCSSLTSITIPNSVTSIGMRAFYNCSSLTSITISNGVTSIGMRAFYNCSSLTSIDIPNSVTSIGGFAFYNCSSLTSVTCLAETAPSLGSSVFYSTPPTKTLTVPCESDYSAWESATTWASVERIGCEEEECVDVFTIGDLTYEKTSATEVSVKDCSETATEVIIPASVEQCGITYSVTAIGEGAFSWCSSLTSVDIPNSVTSIGNFAFYWCRSLTSVDIPNSVTSIGNSTFFDCSSLTSVTIPNSVTYIGTFAFYNCSSLTSVTIPNSVTSIETYAFAYCDSLTSVTCLAETAPSLGASVFLATPSNKTLTVPFNASGYTSDWGNATWQKIYHKIEEGEIKTLTNAFEITEDNKRGVINEGVLRITQSGQLINQTSTNVGGIIEIETPTLANDKWSFIGAPFNNYKLEVVKPGTKDISISLFDYTTGNWAEDFATIDDSVGSGEGFFAWSFAAEPTVFTTYGDGAETYNFETTPAYSLNNDTVNVTKNLTTHAEGGNWLALSNPYTFKLDVGKFLNERDSIKGGVVYRFNGSVWTPVSEGEINMTEGFFVNFENPGTHSVSFSKYYIYEPAKSKALETKDYITLNVAEGENVSKLRFAQNPKAKQGDDIFDANKLFSPLEITEPYFVTDGVALVKEEVKEYPYTATLNIRNYETKEVTLSIDNIPEGVNVYLIDNGFEVKMNGGVEYNTRIIAGENADRFKVLFKKQHRLERIKDNQISITNNNRQISIKSDKTDLNIEVYNQLGQKVFSTNEYNFTLSEQPAGSYVIKAYQGRFSESKKIVIE